MALRPNTTYYYRVKALNSTQESNYSNVVAVTTATSNLQVTPIAPSNPTLYSYKAEASYIELYFSIPGTNEYIEELKLTVSTNSDYSSPLYSELTYILNKNTNYIYINNTRYIVITISNLSSNTLYYIRCRYANDISLSGYTSTSITTAKTLKPPTLLGVSDLSAIDATVEWTPVKGATSYELDAATDTAFTSLVVNNVDVGNVTSREITALTENTTYHYRVRAKNVSVTSASSSIDSFTTLDDVQTYTGLGSNLAIPSILSLENIYTTQFTISWSVVAGAEDYTVQYSTSSDFSSPTSVDTVKTKHTFSSLTAGTLYYVRVKANSDYGDSAYSTSSLTTLVENAGLTTVQVFNPTTIFSNGFIVTWTQRTYANKYLIQLSIDNFSNVLASIFVGDINSYLIDNLNPDTDYYVRVYALNSINSSQVSNVITVTTEEVLPSINISSVTELTASSVRLNWTTNAAYDKYLLTVYSKFSNEETSAYLGNGYYNELDLGFIGSHVIELFLNPNTTYEYFLTGVSESGDTLLSDIEEFTTRSIAPIAQISNDGKYLEWSNTLNRLEVATDSQFKNCLPGWNPRTISTTENKYLISNLLESNTNYYIRGFRVLNSIEGEFSPVLSTFRSTPTLLEPIVTKTTAKLRWKKNDSSSYRIQLLVDNMGNFVPVSGFTFPVNVGDVDTYTVENLTADTTYQVKIQYYNSSLEKYSSLSLPITFKTNKVDSLTELDLNSGLTDVGVTSSDISFDKYTLNLTGNYNYYIIQISRRSDYIFIEKTIETTEDTITLTGLDNTDYYIRVYEVDEGASEYTDPTTLTVTTTTVPANPSAVTGYITLNTVTVLNETEVRLVWTDISNEIGYVVEVSQSNSFDLLEKDLTIVFDTTTSAIVSGLSGAITYYARVYGYNRVSTSSVSNVLTIDTTP